VILLIVGVTLFSQSAFSRPQASLVLSTEARDGVALAPTQTMLVQPGVVAVETQLGFVGEETGGTVDNKTGEPLVMDGTFLAAPPVANQAAPSSEQPLAPDMQGDDAFMQYATGTPPPQPTAEPMTDMLRFAADATETPEELNTQSRVDEETETQASQDAAADMADSSAALSQQESAPAPASAAGGAAAEAPLPQATMLPTTKPSVTPTHTPSPAPTSTPPPTLTPSPAPTNTLAPTLPPPSATLISAAAPAQPAEAAQRAPESSGTLGIGLIMAALVLFGVALVTTVARRRG
jgi:hypothetical protein